MHWKTALCSLSTGMMRTPFARALSMTRAPAVTSVSLLARATSFPASMAASVGTRPAAPTMADKHEIGGVCRRDAPVAFIAEEDLRPDRGIEHVRRACGRDPRQSRRRSGAESAPPVSFRTPIFFPAARATTSSAPGFFDTTSRALTPIDPVEPRMAIFFTRVCTSCNSRQTAR